MREDELVIEDLQNYKSSFDLLFSEPQKIKYEDLNFDFELDPDHFVRWLIQVHKNDHHGDYEYKENDYAFNVGRECEFSCLYVAMLLHKKQLESEPTIYSGNFGFWDHYWIGYFWKSQEYFIDLTLQQFVPDAPKLAISKPVSKGINEETPYEETAYRWYEDIKRETISEYIERQRAFHHFVNPIDVD